MNQYTVLIVEDEKKLLQTLGDFLHMNGYQVLKAEDGEAAIEKARQHMNEIDIILLDIMLPKKNGYEVLKEIRNYSNVPVILLTAKSEVEDQLEGFECGADSYVSKPFNSQLLLTRIKNLIANSQRLKQLFSEGHTASKESVSEIEKDFIDRFRSLLENNLSNSELSVEDLGEQMGLSRVQLYRKIKALTNYSPVELLRITRLKKASALLSTTDKTISEITYEVGFTSPSYFTKCYKEYFGESPSDFLKRKNS